MEKVPDIKVEPPGPEAKKAVAKDDEWLVKATKSWPLVFKKAEGTVIEDVDGNKYIDFYAGVGVLNCRCKASEGRPGSQRPGRQVHACRGY